MHYCLPGQHGEFWTQPVSDDSGKSIHAHLPIHPCWVILTSHVADLVAYYPAVFGRSETRIDADTRRPSVSQAARSYGEERKAYE
ncbi:MAG: hypothetical protein ACYS3N_24270 [Planctomycetota bacterium]